MEFTLEHIKKVAKLAKIRLSNEEMSMFTEQFSSIIQVINKLQSVDTTDVTPIHNVSTSQLLMRDDIVTDGNYAEDIIANAPKAAFNCFVVPKVVE